MVSTEATTSNAASKQTMQGDLMPQVPEYRFTTSND
jgi:hypothetical protein